MFIYLDLHSFSSAYIYPIVYVVSCVVRNQFATAEEFPINERFPFLFTFLCSLAETTCGFILLFKKCYKKYNKELKLKEVTVDLGSTTINKKELIDKSKDSPKLPFFNDNNLYILIPLSLGNFFICFVSFCLGGVKRINENNYSYQVGTLSLIWLTFLCHKLINTPIYKHHFISIVLICLCQIILGCGVIKIIKLDEMALDFSLLLLCDLFFSTKHAIEKYLMEKKNMLVYKLIFIEGILGIIINVVFVFVFWYIPCPPELEFCSGGAITNFDKLFDNLNKIPFDLFMIYALSIGVNLFVLLTNKFFSPTHRFVFDTVSSILQIVIGAMKAMFIGGTVVSEITLFWKITNIVTYGVIFIGCLIYNEIIVLNFCGIGDFTKNQIIERSIEEQDEAMANILNISLTPKDDRYSNQTIPLVEKE